MKKLSRSYQQVVKAINDLFTAVSAVLHKCIISHPEGKLCIIF